MKLFFKEIHWQKTCILMMRPQSASESARSFNSFTTHNLIIIVLVLYFALVLFDFVHSLQDPSSASNMVTAFLQSRQAQPQVVVSTAPCSSCRRTSGMCYSSSYKLPPLVLSSGSKVCFRATHLGKLQMGPPGVAWTESAPPPPA